MTTEITVREPSIFFGSKDEKYFFSWLKSIEAIESFRGEATGLKLTVRTPIRDEDLVDLIALMSRYKLNLKTLVVFCTAQNAAWFKDPKKYWYQAVFGDTCTPD